MTVKLLPPQGCRISPRPGQSEDDGDGDDLSSEDEDIAHLVRRMNRSYVGGGDSSANLKAAAGGGSSQSVASSEEEEK